ncbi:hypothetical protein BAU15_02940 [Enterococcus sp. JM4C]|uniref:Gfo/Idh/MocA family protein n=1 Tax=Candidatus Enterococcus huntleyi TaxID=1857217 RepID=UPI00137B7797|nr:Gfo/Idh/MocA family oxidoreductase [Enterococcus sp. JM4C]KAF1299615.1 hypothetical protein BAU15_02940 [Enterococcus sp. JM4C]
MLHFGIIGCGGIARTHALGLVTVANVELKACCDTDEKKGEAFSREFNCQFYRSYQEMLQDSSIDAVIIATPHYLHAKMSIAALTNKKHVLCEKPMATTLEDAKRVLQVAASESVQYHVCYQNRFNPSFVQLKEWVMAEKFGKLRGIRGILTWCRKADYYDSSDWKGTWVKEGGGVLINQAIHSIDAITWLVGIPQKIKGEIMTSLLDEVIEVEDTAMATAIMNPDIPLTLYATNSYSQNATPEIVFDYEEATVTLTNEELFVDGKKVEIQTSTGTASGKDYWGNGHQQLLRTFSHELEGQENPLRACLASEDAVDSLSVVLAIYESAKIKQWVSIDKMR